VSNPESPEPERPLTRSELRALREKAKLAQQMATGEASDSVPPVEDATPKLSIDEEVAAIINSVDEAVSAARSTIDLTAAEYQDESATEEAVPAPSQVDREAPTVAIDEPQADTDSDADTDTDIGTRGGSNNERDTASNGADEPDPASDSKDALSWVGTTPSEGSAEAAPLELPRRRRMRPSVIIPILAILALVSTYVVAMANWSLHEVAPEIQANDAQVLTAPESELAWPSKGSAAVGVDHLGAISASDTKAVRMASISKLLTALMVLDRMPLAVGEKGTTFFFTQNDRNDYHAYRNRGETALNVPVDGSLTQYEMLQAALIGSANNYSDRLVRELWGSGEVYRVAAAEWLAARGLDSIKVQDGTSLNTRNTASPEDIIELARLAISNPVIREIVGTTEVRLAGAGRVTTTNPLLGDEGVIGVTQGTIGNSYHLVIAKEIEVAGAPVRIFAAVLNQSSRNERTQAARDLLVALETEINEHTQTVPAGTVVGNVTTLWGETAKAITTTAIDTPLWNGGSARTDSTLHINWDLANLGNVGTYTVIGPLGARSSDLVLDKTLEGPDFWWRITHPFELLGLAGTD
jgi:D-alanyl-D-alanine carboxypeptidase (penicillin-binding protein 5/6)